MSDQSNVFKFDLNELLSFQKGQEVMELIGIALEPDISIFESDEYVTIRGVIELTGEYMPLDSAQNDRDSGFDSQVLSFQERQLKNYVKDIRSFEDGLNEFHYHIPVEVTIPKYRVPSLDDVMVEIDYFDYQIPDPSQIKLQAEVVISGIKQESTGSPVRKEEEQKNEWEDVNQPFSFDLKFEQEESSSSIQAESSTESEVFSSNEEHDESIESKEEKDRELWFKKKSQSFDEFFGKNKEVVEDSPEDVLESPSPSPSPSYELQVENNQEYEEETFEIERPEFEATKEPVDTEEVVGQMVEEANEGIEHESVAHEEARAEEETQQIVDVVPKVGYASMKKQDEANEESERNGEDVFYLVNMFNREEESYSSIRMCIVQEADTLDSIADRYEMNKSQIARYNNLNEDEVKAGDILYIPKSKNKSPS